jgi:peptide/nickel transport system permease protein
LVLPALAVEAALRFSYSIFLVASLGFLGIGVQPPSSNWGMMVNEARDHVNQLPWSMYLPIAAISLLVVSVNLTADSLRRILQGVSR